MLAPLIARITTLPEFNTLYNNNSYLHYHEIDTLNYIFNEIYLGSSNFYWNHQKETSICNFAVELS